MTDWLKKKNNAVSELASGLAASASAMTVASVSPFPTEYPYHVTIWDFSGYTDPGSDPGMEIVEVTSSAGGDSLNITRAKEGTSDVAHGAEDRVALLVTTASTDQWEDAIDLNTTLTEGHITSNGSSHSFLDQSVVIGSSPSLDGENFVHVSADDVDISDAGGYYTGTEVESALQEVGADAAQYLLADGTRALTGDWSAGANAITITGVGTFGSAADVVQHIVNGHATQSANFMEVRKTGGDYVFAVESDGRLVGGSHASYPAALVHLDLSSWSNTVPAADLVFPGGGYFRVAKYSIKGTDDIFFQAVCPTTSAYGFLEAWQSAGMVVGTGGNTSPVIFQVNRTEVARITSSQIVPATDITIDERAVTTISLPPREMALRASAPAAYNKDVAATNFPYDNIVFADAASKHGVWHFDVPDSYDGSNITVTMKFVLGATTNAVMKNQLRVVNVADDEAFDVAFVDVLPYGDRTYGSATHATGDIWEWTFTWDTNKPSAGDRCIFWFSRFGAHAADTINEDVELVGIKLELNGDI